MSKKYVYVTLKNGSVIRVPVAMFAASHADMHHDPDTPEWLAVYERSIQDDDLIKEAAESMDWFDVEAESELVSSKGYPRDMFDAWEKSEKTVVEVEE